ncbi:MAG: hypothetical protein JWR22_877 [Herminiimonas sp.]|nr:hypothetical protein [Herminiimonas sp.]
MAEFSAVAPFGFPVTRITFVCFGLFGQAPLRDEVRDL